MPATGVVTSTSFVDTNAIPVRPIIAPSGGGTGFSGPKWKATKIHLRAGRQPSYAEIDIPLAKLIDETAPTVAGVSSSPLAGMRHGDDVSVVAQYPAAGTNTTGTNVTLITGVIKRISGRLLRDRGQVTIWDHRYVLNGWKIVGRFCVNDASGGTVSYQQGVRPHCNERGGANCTLGPYGPCFCDTNFGLADGEQPYQVLTKGKASYWTVGRVLQYLQWIGTGTAVSLAQTGSKFLWYKAVDSRIVWSPGYANGIDDGGAGSTTTSSIQKCQEMDLEGQYMVDALSKILEIAGPYALYMKPVNNSGSTFQSELKIVRTRYGGRGLTIGRAAGGDASVVQQKSLIFDGEISEDSGDLFTLAVVGGDTVYIERRIDTTSTAPLIPAWSAADLTSWKTLVTTPLGGLSAYSQAAFDAACAKYPRVFAAWRINPAYDFQAGTTQAGYPRASVNRPPLTHLLSSYLAGTGSTMQEKASTPYPVRFEFCQDPDSAPGVNWQMATIHDQLEVDPVDGTIWIPALRTAGNTLRDKTNGGQGYFIDAPNLANLAASDIRVTLAIPCDHRQTQAMKLSCDTTGGVDIFVPAEVDSTGNSIGVDDSDRIAYTLSRMFYADSAELYAYWERNASYPVPQSAGGLATTDAKPYRDDTSYLAPHLKKRLGDLGKLNRAGRLVTKHLRQDWEPGIAVDSMNNEGIGGNFPIRAQCTEVVFSSSGKAQLSEMFLS